MEENEMSTTKNEMSTTKNLEGTLVTVYRITITKAWRMDELGAGYSFDPWSGDDAIWAADCEPVRRYIAPGTYLAESQDGSTRLYRKGTINNSGMTCSEARQAGCISSRKSFQFAKVGR
jgi:hypothetical protein